MRPKIKKLLVLLLCFLLCFEQSGFAQMAGQLDISGHLAGLRNAFTPDVFRPLHLRYLQYNSLNNSFQLFLDKGSLKNPQTQELENTTKELLKYFFIGVTLPNDTFWVNLRPDADDQIIDHRLAQTDIGKIMLETDLQLKKDTARFTSPETPKGKEYWDKLYRKAKEIFGSSNITIPTLTRPWIVPNEIIIRETADSAYIYKATLKVMLEQDYLKDSAVYNFKDDRLKELNEYSSQLIREIIIPKLTKEVNSSKRYASLRQVYYSLIMAQWFKARFKGLSPSKVTNDDLKGTDPDAQSKKTVPDLIDSQNLTNLTSKESWSKTTYFQAYQRSFQEGEYNIKEPIYTPFGQTIRSYFSGGEFILIPMPLNMGEEAKDPKTGGSTIRLAAGSSPMVNGHNIVVRADALGKVYVDDIETVPPQKESELPGKALDALIDSYDQAYFKKEYEKAYKILREIVAMDPGAAHNTEGYFVWLRAVLLQKYLNDENREKIIATLSIFHSNARLLSYLILRRFRQDRTLLNLVIRNKALDMRIRLYAAGLMMLEHEGGLFFFSETEVQSFIENMGNSEQDRKAISNILISPLGRYDIQAYIFALIVWIARANYDLANTLFGNREKLLIILNRIMRARLGREYDNASDLFLIGDNYIRKGSSRELFFVLAHELMHNILTHNFEFESRHALGKQSIHEFIGDLLAGFFASRVGWDWGQYLEIVNAQLQYNRVLGKEYRSIEGHEAARAQILIIAKHLNLVEDPYAWEHLFESSIATIIEGQVPRGKVSLIHEDFYEFIRKSLIHYTTKYLRRNIDSSIGSEKPTPKKQIKEGYYTFVVPDKVVLEIFGLTAKTNSSSPEESSASSPASSREDVREAIELLANEWFGKKKVALEGYGDRQFVIFAFMKELEGLLNRYFPEAEFDFKDYTESWSSLNKFYTQYSSDKESMQKALMRLWEIYNKYLPHLREVNKRIAERLGRSDVKFTKIVFLMEGQGSPMRNIVPIHPDNMQLGINVEFIFDEKNDVFVIEDIAHEAGHGFIPNMVIPRRDLEENEEISANWAAAQILSREEINEFLKRQLRVNLQSQIGGKGRVYYLSAAHLLAFAQKVGITNETTDVLKRFTSEDLIAEYVRFYEGLSWASSPAETKDTRASSPTKLTNQTMTPGGIDFRSLHIVTQAISNLSINISSSPIHNLEGINLDEEWQQIERMANSGITPSSERIKEYLQVSCFKGNLVQDIAKIILCISDILRLEEERCDHTNPTLRDILVILESISNMQELRQIFLGGNYLTQGVSSSLSLSIG